MKYIRRVLDSAAAVAAIALATGASATTCETQVLLYGMNDVSQDNAGPDQIVRGDLGTGVCSALHTFNAGDDDMESLAWDPVLHVFWATNANILLHFDPLTYAETNVGDTGVGDIDGVAVQPGTGTLFAVNYGGNDLMTLDKNTAVATVLNGHLKEGHRLYKVLNTRLEGREFVADQYSIADIAIWPWISRFEWQTIDMKQYPNVKRWYETIAARPAVQKGYRIPKDMGPVPMPT